MVDHVSPEKRSQIMRAVHGKNTAPEMTVRKMVFAMGYRYRIHTKGLAGTPDLVFVSRRKVIFVHGCFWHGHECKKGKLPKSQPDYWKDKIGQNTMRDSRNISALRDLGWDVLVIWQCELKDAARLTMKISSFLG